MRLCHAAILAVFFLCAQSNVVFAQAVAAPTGTAAETEKYADEGGIQQKPAEHPRNLLLIEMRALDRFIVHVNFHAKQRNWKWPAGREVYILKDSQFHTFRISCTPGEKICYGAGRSGNYAKYWGAGISGRNGCSSCCMQCGNSYKFTLQAAR
jgi:hypothetical protein